MQAQSTEQDGLVLRTARKEWTCDGSGGLPNTHAEACPQVICPGEQYVECLWETHAYASGTRHAIVCAVETHGWKA
jgi:hypothetical protein